MSCLTYLRSIIKKTRMLADCHIPRVSNDMKIALLKNHLEGLILYSMDRSKKPRHCSFPERIYGKL